MKLPIAVFMNDIGPAILNKKDQENLFGIVRKNSELEKYTREHCSLQTLSIEYKDRISEHDALDEAIMHTDLAHVLRRHRITTLLVPSQQSTHVVRWAETFGFQLLGPAPKLQRALEDKIHFDRMMRLSHIAVPPLFHAQELKKKVSALAVLQKKMSTGGGVGTTIVKAGDVPVHTLNANVLLRKYIDGIALGVSIILDSDGNYFCSALRRQCFLMDKKNSPQLIGLQWIPTASLPKKSILAVEKMISQLIDFFLDAHFFGIANIDFILSADGPYVIECNPRFSGATPQVFSKKSLTPHPHAWQFLLRTFLHQKNMPFHDNHLPLSLYQGSLVYIDAEKKMLVSGNTPVGMYALKGSSLRPCTPRTHSSFFLLHDLPKNQSRVDRGDTICYIMSDMPFFSKEGVDRAETIPLRAHCLKLFTAHA